MSPGSVPIAGALQRVEEEAQKPRKAVRATGRFAHAVDGQAAPERSVVLALQRKAGNRAVTAMLNPKPLVLQRQVTVNPLPIMRSQWTFGLGMFFDPNCGWYCQIAAIGQRAAALGLTLPQNQEEILPKTTVWGYRPGVEGKRLTTRLAKPASLHAWETMLTQYGPVIVSGKLGRADWGPTLRGVGHFILIVGADAGAGTLEYMDPLKAAGVQPGDYNHMSKRIDGTVYVIQDQALQMDLDVIRQRAQNPTSEVNLDAWL